jgi:hypothetical protein
MMINKRTTAIIISILAFVVISATVFYSATASRNDAVMNVSLGEIGNMVNNARSDVSKNEVVATINGEAITKEQVLMKKHELSLNNKNYSMTDVQDAVAYDVVLIQMTKEQDLYPTIDETLEYVNLLREIYEEGLREDPDNEYLRGMNDYINALGLSNKEYWKDEAVINTYRNILASGKLSVKMANEWGYTEEKLVTVQQIDEFMGRFDEFVNQRVMQSKLTIADESAFRTDNELAR